MNKPYVIKGKGRHYKSPNTHQDLPSVTNILDCYPKQHALVHWSANRQKEFDVHAAYELYKDISGLGVINAETFQKKLDTYIGKQRAHKKELEKAGDIGTRVHKAIEVYLKMNMGLPTEDPPTLEGVALWAYMSWEDWWRENKITPISVEAFIWSDKWGYAGTTDLVAKVELTENLLKRVAPKYRSTRLISHMGETVEAVIDVKTSKGVYEDMFLQLAGYSVAAMEMKTVADPWGMIVRLPKTEDDPEFEVRFLMPEERPWKFDVFMAVKKIWEDKHNARG